MTAALRHMCRYCRAKLAEPTNNLRRAFCARGCFASFYRSRCRVCEAPIRRKNEQQKVCYGKECKAELRRFPEAYSWPKGRGGYPPTPDARRAAETLAKSALKPTDRCLREWSWTPEISGGELELHDRQANLLARLEQNGGRYRLTHPRTFPILSWRDDGEDMARHRAESIALNKLPLRRAASTPPSQSAALARRK